MASTLGVLDVLSRLREESERAATALAAQEDANRSMLQRCADAEAESGRTTVVSGALQEEKIHLEEGRRVAETKRQAIETTLRRLQFHHARREELAMRKREAARTSADALVVSSQKFRSNTSAKVQQIAELRIRLHEKIAELERAREECSTLDEVFKTKAVVRDKVNVDVAKKREKVSIAFADAKEAEDENGRILAMARQVEAELDDMRAEHAEIQAMAAGLRERNASLRNELRHLKRQLGCDGDASPSLCNNRSHSILSSHGRTRSPSQGRSLHVASQSQPRGSAQGRRRYYQHLLVQETSSHNVFSSAKRLPHQPSQHQQRQHQRSNNEIKRTTTLKGPFTTASSMVMPELHLSSPHPGGRNANTEKKIPEIGGLRHEPSRHDQWKQYGEGSRQKVYSSVDSDAERDGTGSMFSYTA